MTIMEKKITERTCVACRQTKPKAELVRVVRGKDGLISVDESGRAQGRGAYVCANAACVALAKKKRALSRALASEIPDELFEELLKYAK